MELYRALSYRGLGVTEDMELRGYGVTRGHGVIGGMKLYRALSYRGLGVTEDMEL